MGLRFKYPSSWKEIRHQDGGAAMLMMLAPVPFDDDEEQALFTIGAVDKGPLFSDLKQMLKLGVMMSIGKAKLIEEGESKFSVKNGYRAIYQGEDVCSIAVAVEHRRQMFNLIFVAPDATFAAWLLEVRKVFDSLELID